MAEYRVDELARAAGTTVGNVRVYQDRDLLPAPVRRGRAAFYSEAHLARLRLIRSLLERGYTFAQIRELITAWQSGRDLTDLLGLEQVLTAPWSDEPPTRMSLAELAIELGEPIAPETIKRAVALGVFERDGDDVVVRSPRLLHTCRELLAAGVPMPVILHLAGEVQRHTDELAALFLRMVDKHVAPTDSPEWPPGAEQIPELAERAGRLRPLAQATVAAFLARSMSRSLSDWVAERLGPLLKRQYPKGS
ncbi:MerR family transcriptional regulator [Saccharomonospora sp. NPDC046836]|uniref:MerR family transcriptional regulator n=1 Tax=Saccharomonospora sp. NPDC046836 TaxID=3156921 RepID=UPI0033F363A1